MNEQLQTMRAIFDKIKQYQRIIITRHIRPDGDAIGSSKGLARILKLSFPNKEIYLQTEDSSDYLAFLGADDEHIDPKLYSDALLIVTDTATADRMSNKNYEQAKEIIKIDHHIDIKPYGNLCWIEDWRSSTCEMIAYFYKTFADELVIDKEAATYIFCGMVTDSGRFRYEATTGETLRLASLLLDKGVDTETLYSHLYLEDYDFLKFQAYVYKKMQITDNGVVYLHVTKAMQKTFNLTTEQASEAVSFLKGIKGCIAQLAFIDMPDGTIRVRLRSRFMTINQLAEKYGGGGHQCTCGATLHKTSEIQPMVQDADKMVAEYKANNKGWL
ncbi:MAG: bifunctional oligoribonuclease/PAP phosphatase NrnA [Clostridia bacterium]|nr:bifunctional oligoribonuclease/PAP phosphatase NrnA [Clostridia bacterium]